MLTATNKYDQFLNKFWFSYLLYYFVHKNYPNPSQWSHRVGWSAPWWWI